VVLQCWGSAFVLDAVSDYNAAAGGSSINRGSDFSHQAQ
jgi:hypothetical protein